MSFDLNNPPPNHSVKIGLQRDETPKEATFRLWRETILFIFAILSASAIIAFCLFVLVTNTSTADDKKWAMGVLSSIVAGTVGYLLKK
jgi:hypothetical protein